MTTQEIEVILQTILEPETPPYDVPTDADWRSLEALFGTTFPGEFKAFIELMSAYSFPGDIYNVPQSPGAKTNGNDTIPSVYNSERELGGWPSNLIPFYGIGNGDYFALDTNEGRESAVYFRDHGDGSIRRYTDSFADWIQKLPAFLNGEE